MSAISVSIIIPIYNAERHLEECLDSCLRQVLKGIEIICVNDGSTDHTGEILERYRKEHDNIVVLKQKNQGPGVARNLGIAHAHGEFVAFMDSDDYYPDQCALKKLYEAAKDKKVLACGGSLYFMDDGKINESDTSHVFKKDGIMYYREFQKSIGYIRFIYNTQFLKDNKICFPVYRRYQDPPFYVRAMVKVDKFYVISDCVYLVRNTDKIVSRDNADILLGVLNAILDILKISREMQLEKLHADMVIDLIERYAMHIYKHIYNKNEDVRKCYEKVVLEIDETLLKQDSRNIRKPKFLSEHEINQIIIQSLRREKELLERINSYENVLIYGAGWVGRTLYNYLLERECRVTIEFMVSADNPGYTACGKPVKSIKDFVDRKGDVLVIIANKNNVGEMEDMAHKYQFKNIEIVSYDEIQLFGADMTKEEPLTIF